MVFEKSIFEPKSVPEGGSEISKSPFWRRLEIEGSGIAVGNAVYKCKERLIIAIADDGKIIVVVEPAPGMFEDAPYHFRRRGLWRLSTAPSRTCGRRLPQRCLAGNHTTTTHRRFSEVFCEQ